VSDWAIDSIAAVAGGTGTRESHQDGEAATLEERQGEGHAKEGNEWERREDPAPLRASRMGTTSRVPVAGARAGRTSPLEHLP